uniref:Uncharacterized protein n=1 Tax=Romanomermis culicivorax TaxID=13658 RepID=A0A915IR23_ROMCU
MCITLATYCVYGVLSLVLIALVFSPTTFYRVGYSAAGSGVGYIRVQRSETFGAGDYFCDKQFLRHLRSDNVTTALMTMGESEIIDALELPDGTKIKEQLRDIGRCRFLLQNLEDELKIKKTEEKIKQKEKRFGAEAASAKVAGTKIAGAEMASAEMTQCRTGWRL